MRCLDRNKSVFYYALYAGKTPITDEYGNLTGEYVIAHGNPVRTRANISPAQGETTTRQFGEYEAYDKVILMENPWCPIDEHSILWVDTLPQLTQNGELARDENGNVITPWDYEVVTVARSLNSVAYAVKKVTVSA